MSVVKWNLRTQQFHSVTFVIQIKKSGKDQTKQKTPKDTRKKGRRNEKTLQFD